MFITREYDLREIRRLLQNPREHRPNLDIIVSNMVAAEQHMLNRQMGVNRGWTHRLITIQTVAAQATYILNLSGHRTFGKPLYVYQDTDGNTRLQTIPFIDFTQDSDNTRFDFWVTNQPSRPEVAVFRDGEDVKIQVAPEPTGVVAISIGFTTGVLDFTKAEWTETPFLPEFSRYRQLHSALATIPKCEWEGYTAQQNLEQRKELSEGLMAEYKLHDSVFTEYLQSRQPETGTSEMARRLVDNLG